MIRGVLFDLDGVLVDSKQAWIATVNALRRELGRSEYSDEQFDAFWGQSVADDVRLVFEDRFSESEVVALYAREFPRHVFRVRLLDETAPEVLAQLEVRGYRMAVATNSPRAVASSALEAVGLAVQLPVLVTPQDVPHGKPAPDMLLECCRRLSIAPAEALMLGDTTYDNRAAIAAGTQGLAFRTDAANERIEEFASLLLRLPALT